MCDNFELEQDFNSLEIPEMHPCDFPPSMTDPVLHTMDEMDFPRSGDGLFDTPSEKLIMESVDSPDLKEIRLNSTIETGFDDLENIKQELDDELSVSSHDISHLKEKAEGVERAGNGNETSFKGIKICATRHGCTGATNCDYSYGAPIGR